jgi:hypothetical protein
MRRRFARWVLGVLSVVTVGVQLIRPVRTNPPVDAARTLHARISVPSEVKAVFDRACRDCHSHETRWPWYSNVAPVSWLVIDHVNHGRSHLNFSDWAQYTPADAEKLIEKSCKLARDGSMPMPSYLWMHHDARLDTRDIELICDWASGPAQ